MPNEKSKIRDENFYTVLGWMLNVLDLKGNELIVFAIIYSFSQDGESEYTGSLKYLKDFANICERSAPALLASLVNKNYIIKREFFYEGSKVKRIGYRVNFEEIDRMKRGLQNIIPDNSNAE